MEVLVWKYQNTNGHVYFRGRVRVYRKNKYADVACEYVRETRGEARKDANKLLNKLKKHGRK